MGQEDGEKAAAAADVQPAIPKSDRLLATRTSAPTTPTTTPPTPAIGQTHVQGVGDVDLRT